jgi:peptidoglycan glycosyltransferase
MISNRTTLRAQIARAGRWLLLCFIVIGLALPYWTVIRAPDLLARPQNVRPLDEEARTLRGRILDANGVELARSVMGAYGYVKRSYTVAALSHVTGYWSLRYGVSGVEAARNDLLRGSQGQAFTAEALNRLLHRPLTGNDVVLTIDARIQSIADQALGNERGAVVVLDVHSGAIIALASHPFFDANRLDADIDRLKADASRPLLNRATQGLYPPGSTFKTLTLAAALEHHRVSASTMFTYTLRPPDSQHHGWWHVADQQFTCENHPANHTPFDLTEAYAWSCNVAFGDMALAVGPDDYREMARRFGLGRPLAFELPTAASQLFSTPDYFTGQERFYALASTGFGQGQIAVTPLQMALVAAAVANDGKMPQPYLVARVQSPAGRTIEVARPRSTAVMSSQTAATVRRMMITSVDNGWAQSAAVPGVKVGGKTGTAETAAQQAPHSWFIGFVPGDSPRYAIAVIMERAGFGSAQAAPAAKRVMEALLF